MPRLPAALNVILILRADAPDAKFIGPLNAPRYKPPVDAASTMPAFAHPVMPNPNEPPIAKIMRWSVPLLPAAFVLTMVLKIVPVELPVFVSVLPSNVSALPLVATLEPFRYRTPLAVPAEKVGLFVIVVMDAEVLIKFVIVADAEVSVVMLAEAMLRLLMTRLVSVRFVIVALVAVS